MYKVKRGEVFFLKLYVFIIAIYLVSFSYLYGYFPAPIFYDNSDTFMDFFHVQYWVYDQGRYIDWKSIYTPFSFWIVSLFPYPENNLNSLELRDEGYLHLISFYVAGLAVYLYYQSKLLLKENYIFLALAILSAPILFLIERGNLLFLCLLFLLISVNYYKKDLTFSIFMAMAISLKIYLFPLLFIPLLRLEFLKIILTLAFVILFNVISADIIGESDWLIFIDNIFEFSSEPRLYEWSYFTFSYLNISDSFLYVYPKFNDLAFTINVIVLPTVAILYFFASVKYFFSSNQDKEKYRDTLFLLLIMLIMIIVKNAGGYVFVLLMPFLSSLIINRFSLYMFLFMILPVEITIFQLDAVLYNNLSFVSGEAHDIPRDLTSGMILRPVLFLIMYFFVAINFLLKNSKYKNA